MRRAARIAPSGRRPATISSCPSGSNAHENHLAPIVVLISLTLQHVQADASPVKALQRGGHVLLVVEQLAIRRGDCSGGDGLDQPVAVVLGLPRLGGNAIRLREISSRRNSTLTGGGGTLGRGTVFHGRTLVRLRRRDLSELYKYATQRAYSCRGRSEEVGVFVRRTLTGLTGCCAPS